MMSKTSIGSFLTAFAILTMPFAAPVVSANGQLDQILANMQTAGSRMKTFSAGMNQQKRNTQLGGRPEIYNGEILLKHAGRNNDKLRINYTNGQVVVVDGDRIVLYQPAIKQVLLTSRRAQAGANQEYAFIATLYSSVPELKSRYQISYVKEENVGGASTAMLDLKPIGKSSIRKASLWVDRTLWIPIKAQAVEQNGDVSTFTVTNIKVNPSISDGVFKFTWPSGTRVVRK